MQIPLHPRWIIWRTHKGAKTMTRFTFREVADYAAAAVIAVTATTMLFAATLVQSVNIA
jgi:hypothetical protein